MPREAERKNGEGPRAERSPKANAEGNRTEARKPGKKDGPEEKEPREAETTENRTGEGARRMRRRSRQPEKADPSEDKKIKLHGR